jgi:hypothetical protein
MAERLLLLPPLVMSTLIKWSFDGGADGSEVAKKRGEQRACAGDKVHDEMLGPATLIGRAETIGYLRLEFIDGDEKRVQLRTCGHIYALEQRPERRLDGSGKVATFFGAKSPAAPAAGVWRQTKGGGGKLKGPWQASQAARDCCGVAGRGGGWSQPGCCCCSCLSTKWRARAEAHKLYAVQPYTAVQRTALQPYAQRGINTWLSQVLTHDQQL